MSCLLSMLMHVHLVYTISIAIYIYCNNTSLVPISGAASTVSLALAANLAYTKLVLDRAWEPHQCVRWTTLVQQDYDMYLFACLILMSQCLTRMWYNATVVSPTTTASDEKKNMTNSVVCLHGQAQGDCCLCVSFFPACCRDIPANMRPQGFCMQVGMWAMGSEHIGGTYQ